MTTIPDTNNTIPLPPHALGKAYQYKLVKVGVDQQWVHRARFKTTKHRGECRGAFGGRKKS